MKGGHARSGPAPDPNALRRERDSADWVDLPAGGRSGDLPQWPLAGSFTKREQELWELLWSKPQAIMWELRGQELEVAIYVRSFRRAEQPKASTSLIAEVRRQMEQLGLSSMGLRANRWRIVSDDVTAKRQERRASAGRDRLKIVDSG